MNELQNVYICAPREEGCTSSSWGDSKMYTHDTIANPQRTPNNKKKNDAIAKVSILVEQVII